MGRQKLIKNWNENIRNLNPGIEQLPLRWKEYLSAEIWHLNLAEKNLSLFINYAGVKSFIF